MPLVGLMMHPTLKRLPNGRARRQPGPFRRRTPRLVIEVLLWAAMLWQISQVMAPLTSLDLTVSGVDEAGINHAARSALLHLLFATGIAFALLAVRYRPVARRA